MALRRPWTKNRPGDIQELYTHQGSRKCLPLEGAPILSTALEGKQHKN